MKHQGFTLSDELSTQFDKKLKELGITKSDFLRELITSYLDNRVTIKATKQHKLNRR